QLSGDWYEVARAPDVDNTQCPKYELPSTPDADNYIDIKLEYVSGSSGDAESESGRFPWDDDTKNGIFSWSIGGISKLPVTFKVVDADSTSYVFLCGYMGIAPVPLFKILTRQRELSDAQKTNVQQRFNDFGQTATLVWVEQNEEKCNSAMRATGGSLLLLLVVAVLLRR
ncbi:hypothetical protein KR093_007104, partial [Drosophila rubida]